LACSTDTFVAPDSGSDSGSTEGGVEAGGPDACAVPQACLPNQICLDFDHSASYSPFVDASKNGGKVEISSDQFVTCPHSMLSTVPIATATTPPSAAVAGVIPIQQLATAHGHLEADVYLPEKTPGAAGYLTIAANADLNTVVMLGVSQGGDWALYVQATTNAVTIQPRVGAWNHVVLDVTYSSSGGTGKATLQYTDTTGTTKTAQISDSTLPGGTNVVTSVAAGVGIQPTGASTDSVSAYYDDVAFGAQ
jgi:hypothetical protein